jgi:peptidoglycan/xylan/chitin deacetylase (PgdA/CDA1 family)
MKMHEILRQDPEIWDLFSNKEEYSSWLRDLYDRTPYYTSKNRDIFEPKASQYLIDHGYTVDYPNNASFAVCLTHDIDHVYRSFSSKGRAALNTLKKGNASGTARLLSQIRSKKLPLFNFSEIMNIEEKYGAKSTFFFMAEDPEEKDFAYKIEALEPEIGEIIDRGWEVGLHGGHTTYIDPQEMKYKKDRLERVTSHPVAGYRNHYLRFRVPDTWEYLSQAGFYYDSTFGYADCAGFRNVMCHPYRPINRIKNHAIDILEIPLILMEGSLGSSYMQLTRRSMWDLIKILIDKTTNCHGVFTLVWHNTNMQGEYLELYENILQYCKERKAWITNGEKLSTWWDNIVRN